MEAQKLYGCLIQPYFFDNKVTDGKSNFIERVLPFVQNNVRVLYTEEDKKNFKFGDIIAQPDAVLAQYNHLISLEYKSLSGSQKKQHNPKHWDKQIRLKDIIQAIIGALQVSAVENKACVIILRYVNVAYFISPSIELCEFILAKAPDAKAFYHEKRFVSASQLAELIEPLVKNMYRHEDKATEAGKEMHEQMLHTD